MFIILAKVFTFGHTFNSLDKRNSKFFISCKINNFKNISSLFILLQHCHLLLIDDACRLHNLNVIYFNVHSLSS